MNDGTHEAHTIAIIGQGRMARAHARAWAELGLGDSIRYVCAPGPSTPFADAPFARLVSQLEVVLSDEAVDIVSICTPTPTHAPIAIAALAAGKNVLLEKPIALSLADALAIRAAAQRCSGIVVVAHVVRFFGGYSALRERIESGLIGRVHAVNARRMSTVPGPSPWWHDESKSGGVLVDFAVHDFDQLNLFLGTPVSVTARRIGADGPFEVSVDYENGSVGQVLSFMGMPDGVPFESSIDLIGSAGTASHVFAGALESVGEAHSRSSIRILDAGGERYEPVSTRNPYAAQAEHFLSCVERAAPSTIVPIGAAVSALSVALAARSSVTSGRRESVHRV